jgi:polyisoprenyl-phosphate glycosyltransferase
MSETVSVVVPVYNNQPTLGETCRQIIEIHESSFKELELEVIFVNDGSTDDS